MRGGDTASAFESAFALRPQGSMKSLRKISPGCRGCAVFLLIGNHTYSTMQLASLEACRHIPYNDIRYSHASYSDRIPRGWRACEDFATPFGFSTTALRLGFR